MYALLKRQLDIVLSLIGLIISFPLWLVISLFILASDGRPIFFKQARYGRANRIFMQIKFRTMYNGHHEIRDYQADRRIIPVCAIFRKTALDSLPELINILKGDMSWVGPRPFPIHLLDSLSDKPKQVHLRQTIRPGLSGLAQAKVSKFISPQCKLRLDAFYARNYCFSLDLHLLTSSILRSIRGTI